MTIKEFKQTVEAKGYKFKTKNLYIGKVFSVITKDGKDICSANVFPVEFYNEHKEIIELVRDNKKDIKTQLNDE